MTAIGALLDGFIDYAGTYPPANLDLEAAVRCYLEYRRGPQVAALGRFVIDASRLCDLRRIAGSDFVRMPLAVCAPSASDWSALLHDRGANAALDIYEIKCVDPTQIVEIASRLPSAASVYFEVPVESPNLAALDAASSAGARIKLRMGGVVASAFPSPHAVVTMLRALAGRPLAFKATAGLHHPLRSQHPFTYAPASPVGAMHGFLNLFCAAALIYLGGDEEEAVALLNESDPAAWHVSAESIACRSFRVSTQQIRGMRQRFFLSFGSCSFEEPIADLEALGWL